VTLPFNGTMSPRVRPATDIYGVPVVPGDHVSAMYGSAARRDAMLLPFVLTGLLAREKCCVCLDSDDHVRSLACLGDRSRARPPATRYAPTAMSSVPCVWSASNNPFTRGRGVAIQPARVTARGATRHCGTSDLERGAVGWSPHPVQVLLEGANARRDQHSQEDRHHQQRPTSPSRKEPASTEGLSPLVSRAPAVTSYVRQRQRSDQQRLGAARQRTKHVGRRGPSRLIATHLADVAGERDCSLCLLEQSVQQVRDPGRVS
jgi:hypothetical protein